MIFTEEEKISMLKAMDELIRSDNDIHEKEVEFLEAIVEEFDWDTGFLDKLENFKKEDAIKAVKSLSPEKLEYFQTLLNELANSDKVINEQEMNFIDRVNEFISANSL
ncbi:hypothetical protein NMK71_06625 [Weeksellaceae bacterium KMM 9713]|uniref:Co-chaperone DjlA N-terminal domain-containing protein n=1 Tax=Profundicola chukchiensis TaxID=2961959 RepID=A0A9X4MXT9_9FLAO|nr:hypothetical protein [Profundicola chukchiensis]MDG4946083.1 hypothetical protein [Profundicola chukchiensis]MDG4951064.1 hypothetical protein [Profundicola chukchiensis]